MHDVSTSDPVLATALQRTLEILPLLFSKLWMKCETWALGFLAQAAGEGVLLPWSRLWSCGLGALLETAGVAVPWSIGAFVFEGCCKASVSRTCHRLSPQAGFLFKYKEVLSGAYLSVQTCGKVLGDGTFCTCWPRVSVWAWVMMELALSSSSSTVSALPSWFALVGWNRAFIFPCLCFLPW